MKRDMEVKIGSVVCGRINAANMSEVERQVAFNAMRDAEFAVDAILWVTSRIERVTAYLFRLILRPSLKH